MSSKPIERKFVKIEVKEEVNFDVKNCIIPFSLLFPKGERYIYDGSEKLPFSKRDPLYQTIFLQEFCDGVRDNKLHAKKF